MSGDLNHAKHTKDFVREIVTDPSMQPRLIEITTQAVLEQQPKSMHITLDGLSEGGSPIKNTLLVTVQIVPDPHGE